MGVRILEFTPDSDHDLSKCTPMDVVITPMDAMHAQQVDNIAYKQLSDAIQAGIKEAGMRYTIVLPSDCVPVCHQGCNWLRIAAN